MADADNTDHCGAGLCGNLYVNVFRQAIDASTRKMVSTNNKTGILAIGINGGRAIVQFNSWMKAIGNPEPVTILTNVNDISNANKYNFDNYKVLYIPSAYVNNGGVTVSGINDQQNVALANRQADVVRYINQKGGSLIALGQSRLQRAYQWLPAPLTYTYYDNIYMGVQSDIDTISPNSTADNISHNAWHGYFTGPIGWSGEMNRSSTCTHALAPGS